MRFPSSHGVRWVMLRRMRARLVFHVLLTAWTTHVSAQPKPAPQVQPKSDPQVDLARRHFQSGSAYFEESRYDDAAREFRESYRLSPRVDLLYNIAQCFLRKGDSARATDFLRLYLQGKPEALDRAEGARYIGIVARYYNLDKQRASRILPVPAGGLFGKKAEKMALDVFLGPDEIQGVKEKK